MVNVWWERVCGNSPGWIEYGAASPVDFQAEIIFQNMDLLERTQGVVWQWLERSPN